MQDLDPVVIDTILYGSGESRNIEFKPAFDWDTKEAPKNQKAETTRALLALSNTPGGGYVIIGITQIRNNQGKTETLKKIGVSDEVLKSYGNPDVIGRFVSNYTSYRVKFEIQSSEVSISGEQRRFIAIKVKESTKALPVICKKEYIDQKSHKQWLKEGAVYIRAMTYPIESREIRSIEEWEELILRLLSYKEGIMHDELEILFRQLDKQSGQRHRVTPEKIYDASKFLDLLKRDNLYE